jgi:hypothetical protein
MPEVRIRGQQVRAFDDIGRAARAQHTARRNAVEPDDGNENGEPTGSLPIAKVGGLTK